MSTALFKLFILFLHSKDYVWKLPTRLLQIKMPVFNGYKYEPLCAKDEARFVLLEPVKNGNDPLSCSIIQCRRSVENLEYCAVSYAWGEPKFTENLEVKSNGDTSYLRITPTVNALLRRLRTYNVKSHIWIDAICINQADDDEKAQQIPVMGHIYKDAKVVHIWLGHDDTMTGRVFKFIREASRLPKVEKSEMASRMAKLMKKVFGGGDGLLGLWYFGEFAARPWFARRWVIQEACLAQHAIIHCGSYSIPLPSLVLAATRFQTLDMSDYPTKVMATLRRPTTKLTILGLLWDFHEAQCLDPRDRIAALYGLVAEEYRVHLDYTAHWTELYKQFTTGILKSGNNDTKLQVLFHLFEFGPVSRPGDSVYPSWVPDWRKSRQRVLPYYSWVRNPDTYESYPSSPGHAPKANVTFQQDALQIEWPASCSSLRARRIIYATKFDSVANDERENTEKVLDILNKLFPRTSNSALQLFALSYLVEKIVDFSEPNRHQRSDSSSFDAYIRSIHSQGRRDPSKDGTFDSLRTLGSLLREFCLFKLESMGPRSAATEAYGIGTQQIQVGDIMIPLWSSSLRLDGCRIPLYQEERAIPLRTMLAVRRIGEQDMQCSTRTLNDRKQAETGRIIGSAMCVFVEPTFGDNDNLYNDPNLDDHTDREQQCLMHLV